MGPFVRKCLFFCTYFNVKLMIEIVENKELKEYNTFALDAEAKHFVSINSTEDVLALRQRDEFKQEYTILGAGSNSVFPKRYEGLVIYSNINEIKVMEETEDEAVFCVGSGVLWNDFLAFAHGRGYFGLQNLIDIPSSVGAAPVQNIGAYGIEQKECFLSLEAVDLKTGEIVEMKEEDCQFAYRHSVFKLPENKGRYFITYVKYKLSKNPALNYKYKDIQDKMAEKGINQLEAIDLAWIISDIRSKKLPDIRVLPNAGSFFKNPMVSKEKAEEIKERFPEVQVYETNGTYKLPAAFLIEKAGMKGYRKGDVGIYDKHALIIVNHGSATGEEINAFSLEVINKIKDEFGITLEPEVIFI